MENLTIAIPMSFLYQLTHDDDDDADAKEEEQKKINDR